MDEATSCQWRAYRRRSRMFHRKKSTHTTGLLWISSSMMTVASRRFFSITWKADSMHSPLVGSNGWRTLDYIICVWLIILFHPEVELWYTLGRSEEGVWLSQSRLRYGRAPGWRAAGTDSSLSRSSKMCLLRHLQNERWYFIILTYAIWCCII